MYNVSAYLNDNIASTLQWCWSCQSPPAPSCSGQGSPAPAAGPSGWRNLFFGQKETFIDLKYLLI